MHFHAHQNPTTLVLRLACKFIQPDFLAAKQFAVAGLWVESTPPPDYYVVICTFYFVHSD